MDMQIILHYSSAICQEGHAEFSADDGGHAVPEGSGLAAERISRFYPDRSTATARLWTSGQITSPH